MDRYIGTKIILAEPMDELTFNTDYGNAEKLIRIDEKGKPRPGYRVKYADDYISWSPKDVFEEAYRKISYSEMTLIEEST